MRTLFPFMPKIRVSGEEVGTELMQEIRRMARFYKIDPAKMSARIELLPNPETNGKTHYVAAEVEYDGEIEK